MVSGRGLNGGRGRCYSFWDDYMKCMKAIGGGGKKLPPMDSCQLEKEDYLECLHHRKIAMRMQVIEAQRQKLIKEGKWPPKE
uniref:NADH dehydrogenase [ubiquinone] iron-sulfur protein 5 n=1 Tax=Amphimedon queenslandica TaxID=400682 RepID=A0A1X7V8E7_AMPQE